MELGSAIRATRRRAGLTQAEVAAIAGTSQAAVAAYEGGSKSPGFRTLERLAAAMGAALRVNFVALGVDEHAERRPESLGREERRSLWLHRVIAARIQAEPERAMALARENLVAMGAADESGRSEPWRRAWESLLDGPLDTLLALLCSTSTYASQLRQTAPYAGLLTPRERWAAYGSFERTNG